jgi:hypothetical protein
MKKILTSTLLTLMLIGCGGGSTAETSTAPEETTTNSAPVANAGVDQNVPTGSTVTLDASESNDADQDQLTYSWSFSSVPTGSNVDNTSLSSSNVVNPKFIPDIDGSYILELIVNDGKLDSSVDTVVITASTGNSAPIANAGTDQNVNTGSTVTLDGSASSDADQGDILTYKWSFLNVPNSSGVNDMSLSDTAMVNPTFTPDLDGVYTLQLSVNDGIVDSNPDTVDIVSSTANSAPVANAGPDQNVNTDTLVTLDGSASSDADQDDTLTYSWSITSVPTGSSIDNSSLSSQTTINPTFTPDIDGSYVVQLIVNDGTVNSNTDTVTITASTANSAPVANAGPDQNVNTGVLVTLDGSASSDADQDILTYSWSVISVPNGSSITTSSLSDNTVDNPTFTPDVDGSYVLKLIVSDGAFDSTADTVTIVATIGSYLVSNLVDGINDARAVDMDNDGDMDIVTASYYDDTVAWFEQISPQSFVRHNLPTYTAYDDPHSVFPIDIDFDGDIDVVAAFSWISSNVDSERVVLYINDGSQNFTANTVSGSDNQDNVYDVTVVDLDQDGDLDIVSTSASIDGFSHAANEGVSWYRNDGNLNFTEIIIGGLGYSSYSEPKATEFIDAYDYDNDNDIDIIKAGYVFENDGINNFTPVAASIQELVFDIDADGDEDYLQGNNWYENVDGSYTQHAFSSTSTHRARDVADMNNDNRKDVIAVDFNADSLYIFYDPSN